MNGSDAHTAVGRGEGHPEPSVCSDFFHVRTERLAGDGRVSVAVAGEIDRETAPALQACLGTHLRPGGPLLVVDLTDVSFLNVAGLRVLTLAHQQAVEGKQQLIVVTGDRHRGPRRVLQASGLLGPLAGVE